MLLIKDISFQTRHWNDIFLLLMENSTFFTNVIPYYYIPTYYLTSVVEPFLKGRFPEEMSKVYEVYKYRAMFFSEYKTQSRNILFKNQKRARHIGYPNLNFCCKIISNTNNSYQTEPFIAFGFYWSVIIEYEGNKTVFSICIEKPKTEFYEILNLSGKIIIESSIQINNFLNSAQIKCDFSKNSNKIFHSYTPVIPNANWVLLSIKRVY